MTAIIICHYIPSYIMVYGLRAHIHKRWNHRLSVFETGVDSNIYFGKRDLNTVPAIHHERNAALMYDPARHRCMWSL